MRSRGFALILALIAIATMFSAIAFFSSQMRSRVSAQRVATQHEAAVRQADAILEEARFSLEGQELNSSKTIQIKGNKVDLKARKGGAQITVLIPLRDTKKSKLTRAVRVTWNLENDPANERRWRRVSWNIQPETVP